MAMKISVIMSIYNDATYLSKAIDSVLSQSIPDFEFIICDDASTDKTWKYLQEYQQKDSRVILLRNEKNLGLALSLNRCLEVATGEYIARQDADDISVATRFEEQLYYLESNKNLGFIGSNVALFNRCETWAYRSLPVLPCSTDFLFSLPFVHGSLFFRGYLLKSVGGYRSTYCTQRAEDFDLLSRLYCLNIYGGNIQKPLYWYLEDENALRKRKYSHRIQESILKSNCFKQMDLLPEGLPYILKPLLVGLIPNHFLHRIKINSGIFQELDTINRTLVNEYLPLCLRQEESQVVGL